MKIKVVVAVSSCLLLQGCAAVAVGVIPVFSAMLDAGVAVVNLQSEQLKTRFDRCFRERLKCDANGQPIE